MDKSLILNKIKLHLNLNSDTEFAKFLGIKPQVLSNWRARNTFDTELIYTKCEDVDANWLLTGEGEMLKSPIKQKEPVQQVVEPQEAYNKVAHLEEKIAFLQEKIELLQENKALLEDKVKGLEEKESNRIQELEEEIARLTRENHAIKSQPQ
ncbi:helix-turn-helix domain-containing protein, partial [Ornithobacterium rhinotracheale]